MYTLSMPTTHEHRFSDPAHRKLVIAAVDSWRRDRSFGKRNSTLRNAILRLQVQGLDRDTLLEAYYDFVESLDITGG